MQIRSFFVVLCLIWGLILLIENFFTKNIENTSIIETVDSIGVDSVLNVDTIYIDTTFVLN